MDDLAQRMAEPWYDPAGRLLVHDPAGRLLGLVRGAALFEEEAFEITAQPGAMVGVEREERVTTSLARAFRFRHPWLQLNLLTAFAAGGVVAMFQGTVDGAEVHPREIVRRALAHNAAAVIVGHNHPSGDAEPSAADRAVTARLKQALSLVEVRLLDHFVVGDGPAVSLAARGWV